MVDERTPLRQNEAVPPYVFITNHNRAYKNKIRRFQCCICAGLLAIFITALVITVSYTVNHDAEDENGTTTSETPTTPTPTPVTDPLNTLLTLSWPLQDKPYDIWDNPPNKTEIEEAINEGKKLLAQKELFEEKVPTLQLNSPSYRHQMSTKTLPEARALSKYGFIMEGATKHIQKNRWKSSGKAGGRGPQFKVEWLPKEVCSETESSPCSPSSYRSADGSCNNLKHPRTWGVAMRPFRRIIPPQYADGVAAPRKAKDGSHLPSARDVSLTVHRPFYRDDPSFTVMLAVWGQFIDHDITATALSQGKEGSSISCCNGYFQSGLVQHPECYTVTLESPDPYYEEYNVSCMEFVRSSPAPMCSLGPREQMNQASSFLDGSVVYGTSQNVMDQLRTFEGGELKMLVTPDGEELLPISTDPSDGCNQAEQLQQGRYCFLSGDARSNENIHLTSMHLLLARQHNIIARKLSAINPNWDDEKLFQETRKIVAAQIQHITYNEFLPVILGPRLMEKLKMSPRKDNHSQVYDPTLDPSIANSFAASAFRFGHTLLPGLVRMIAGDNSSEEYIEMHKMLFNPFQLYDKGFLEKSVRGAMNTSVEKVDTYFNTEFTQHLFERKPSIGKPKGMCGLDLVSLNVQRGRDHGLPGYPTFREHCGLERPRTFNDMKAYMDEGSWERIKDIYKDVDDVDMYSGALAEIPLEGGLVGPTITCLLTDQFLRLQRGDRFWYETHEQPQAFTTAQLNEIRRTSLAKIICDTSDVSQAQPMVMRGPVKDNNRITCSELPQVDLTAWKENSRVSINEVPGKIWLIKDAAPKTPKLIKLGGSVSTGSLTINGVSVWSGSFPVKLPDGPFDAFSQNSDVAEVPYPPVFAHGILWSGSVNISNGKATLSGQLSIPQYVQTTSNSKTVAWLNGAFSLVINLNWNSYEGVPMTLSGQYTSPLFFNRNGLYSNESAYDVTINVYPSAAPDQMLNGSLAPIILLGYNSPEGKHFIWNRNISLVIPAAAPPVATANVLKLAYTPKSYVKHVRIGARVTGGTVSEQGQSIWHGELPLSIPVDPFDTIAGVDYTNSDEPTFGHGINWMGSLISKSSNAATLNAQFSFPRFVHSNGITPFSIQWYNGELSLNLDIGWWSVCEDVLNINGSYTTSIHFGVRKFYDYLNTSQPVDIWKSLDIGYAGSPKLYQKGLHAPVILLGSFSEDGKMFYWSGNVTIVLPKVVPLPPPSPTPILTYKQLVSVPQEKLRVPLRLIGGQINVGNWNIWYNTLPVGIPLKPFGSISSATIDEEVKYHKPSSGQTVVWNGTVTAVDSKFVKIQGTFSFPNYSIETHSLKWLKGNFDLQFQCNQTFTINGSYKTTIYFAERSIYEPLSEISISHIDSLSGLGIKEDASPEMFHKDADDLNDAQLILFGIDSYDKTEFLWSGDGVLEIPQTQIKENTKNVLLSTVRKATENSYLSYKVGGTVSQLSIFLNGSKLNAEVQLPVSIPLHLLDNVVTPGVSSNELPAYGQGILWEGQIKNNADLKSLTITGRFSIPKTEADGTLGWYNGNITFNLATLWKTFNSSISGSFSSVLILNDKPKSSSKPGKDINRLIEFTSFNKSSVNPDVSGSAPMILDGEYSPDKKLFLWSGDVTLYVQIMQKPIWEEVADLKVGKQIRIAAFTNGGSITVNGEKVWVGNRVPLAIPLQYFNKTIRPIASFVENAPPTDTVIPWSGFIRSEAPNTVKIWGTYSLPTTSSNTSLSWYNGEFAFELKLLTDSIASPDLAGSFQSIIYLNEMDRYKGLSPEWNITVLKTIMSETPFAEVSPNIPYIPVILDGTYSVDREIFIWSGNVTILLTA